MPGGRARKLHWCGQTHSVKVLAIGGGSVALGETEAIDREFLAQCGTERPKVLFIPTASGDSQEYIDGFTRAYESYGAVVSVLRLHSGEGLQKLEPVDAIYVGGGNTKMMLELWRKVGLDIALRSKAEAGCPVGGLSAGAICWFSVGNSDWPQYEGVPGVNTAPLEGLGWIELAVCPHTRDEGFRLREFENMLPQFPRLSGLGLDDGCALQIDRNRYRILASQEDSFAHRFASGSYSRLSPHADWRRLEELTRPVH